MAAPKIFTQQQLEDAKKSLSELPDLSPNKIPQSEFLEALKDQIITLSTQKGYTPTEIKSALSGVGLSVTTRQIGELISVNGKRRGPSKNNSKIPASEQK